MQRLIPPSSLLFQEVEATENKSSGFAVGFNQIRADITLFKATMKVALGDAKTNMTAAIKAVNDTIDEINDKISYWTSVVSCRSSFSL